MRSADPTLAPTNPTFFSRKRDTALSAPVAAPGKGHNVTIENDVESHLHPTPSWEIADHPMPTGARRFGGSPRLRPSHRFCPRSPLSHVRRPASSTSTSRGLTASPSSTWPRVS
ncbi:iron-sulfur cluster assembly protein SufD [Cutibacterium acnes JCM 18909]|nr:iron-sulfur cluster assembly protein SufD [Cutibacterium acnes JCM 18909]